jgi:hypothetical protein
VCWGYAVSPITTPPTITYEQFLQAKEGHSWLLKHNVEDEYEDYEDEETAKAAPSTSLVQFRQLATGEGFSCGITLLGSHILCWGMKARLKRGGMVREVEGPFRQLSAGRLGICALTDESSSGSTNSATTSNNAEEEYEDYEDNSPTSTSASTTSTSETARPPDQLLCWGELAVHVRERDGFDQVSVGSTGVCAVNLDSELRCWGYSFNNKLKSMMKDVVVA